MRPLLGLLTVFLAVQAQAQTEIQRVLTDERTQIPVICELRADMFPASWRPDPINAAAVLLPASEVQRSQRLMVTALTKYPPSVIKSNLKAVYVCQEIKFYGLGYGGTNSSNAVYLGNKGQAAGYTDHYLESSFHHEFSSILLRNHNATLDKKAWNETLPEGFKYRGSGTQSLREGTASTRYSQDYHRDGFLAQYATSSLEEDFNMTAEGLFMGQRRFWAAVDQNPKLKAKVGVVIKFYNNLNTQFTEDFFRKLARLDSERIGQNSADGR